MVDRIVLGRADSNSFGLWISKEGVNVVDGSGNLTSENNLLFDSRKQYFGQILAAKVVILPPQTTVTINYNPYGQKSYGFLFYTDVETERLSISYQSFIFNNDATQVLLTHTYSNSSTAAFTLENISEFFAFRPILLIVRAPG